MAIASVFLSILFIYEQFIFINQIDKLEQKYQVSQTEINVHSFIAEKKNALKFSKTSKYIKEFYGSEFSGFYLLKLK